MVKRSLFLTGISQNFWYVIEHVFCVETVETVCVAISFGSNHKMTGLLSWHQNKGSYLHPMHSKTALIAFVTNYGCNVTLMNPMEPQLSGTQISRFEL